MSFSISFVARDIHDARQKLQQQYAPAAVKALIELALIGAVPPVPPPQPSRPQRIVSASSEGAAKTAYEEAAGRAGSQAESQPHRKLLGIKVETFGHIADLNEGGRSWLDRFVVEALVD
jgi:hypothetical protein